MPQLYVHPVNSIGNHNQLAIFSTIGNYFTHLVCEIIEFSGTRSLALRHSGAVIAMHVTYCTWGTLARQQVNKLVLCYLQGR